MKRLVIWIAAILMPIMGFAQAQVNTKKVKISDFTQKVTKVVLTGNMFYDSSLQDEIVARWKVSPYEFCSLDEFEELKGNDEYYFLLSTKGQFKKETEPGLQFLTLVIVVSHQITEFTRKERVRQARFTNISNQCFSSFQIIALQSCCEFLLQIFSVVSEPSSNTAYKDNEY